MQWITSVMVVLLTCLMILPNAPAGEKGDSMADAAAVIKGDNEFAFDLYAKLRDKEGNLFFSPDSISTALAMTYAGARGETAEQMARTLHFTLDQDRLHNAFQALLAERNSAWKKRSYELRVANALWGQKGFTFLPSFLSLTRDHYGAGLQELDFRTSAEDARRFINAWVEKETKDKIKDLLEPGDVNPLTRLVLTNAIYFKGSWDQQFQKEQTFEQAFQLSAGKSKKVPMMHNTSHFKYLDGGTFQALELPYKGGDLSMVVLLPKTVAGLPDLEKSLTAAKLAELVARMKMEEVALVLPKFKATCEFRMGGTLAAMGMPLAFGTGADFSGMDGERDLFIGDVIHKAFVDVNEEGTEAAAATGVIMRLAAAPVMNHFQADHPFLFLIRDSRSGGLLFIGRMVNP